jgi:hypothetical protein
LEDNGISVISRLAQIIMVWLLFYILVSY